MLTLEQLMAMLRKDSYEKFAKRTGISAAAVHRFGVGANTSMPPVSTIRGLARALGVPPSLVVITAAQGLGIDMREALDGPVLGRAMPADVDQLPAQAQQVIVDLANILVSLLCKPTDTGEGTGDPGPPRQMNNLDRIDSTDEVLGQSALLDHDHVRS